jgi:hypothetical protein
MSDSKTEVKLTPPFGGVSWFADFFRLMERIKIDKVDKTLLITNNVAPSSNVNSVLNGLRFLDLTKEDGSATERMKSLSVVGVEYQKNFEKMIRDAYNLLFEKVKNLEQALADDVINCFRMDYGLAPSTAKQGAQIFVFLALKGGISLSSSIVEKLEVNLERKQPTTPTAKGQRKTRGGEPTNGDTQEPLPEQVLARFTLKGTGYVDIKNKDDFEIAKAYWKVLSKKLGADE